MPQQAAIGTVRNDDQRLTHVPAAWMTRRSLLLVILILILLLPLANQA